MVVVYKHAARCPFNAAVVVVEVVVVVVAVCYVHVSRVISAEQKNAAKPPSNT